jgi:HSP20 family protein
MASELEPKEGTRDIEARGKQAVEREQTRPGAVFRPDVDIVEQRDEFLVTADLPGVDDKTVEVRLENGVLSIEARTAVELEPAWTPIYAEYRSGGYHREFMLSEEIDAGGIKASMRDGVLEVHLPKSQAARPRTIPVHAG